ncbi:MAG TPA: TIGR02270 family protein [Gemmatimonadales bacterium]
MTLQAVVTQHAEEASFHWLLRSVAVSAPHYDLRDLSQLDTRLDAHIDGLRIAGDDGWVTCMRDLPWEEPGDVFVGMLLALESSNSAKMDEMLTVAAGTPGLAEGAVSALGWIRTVATQFLDGLLKRGEPIARLIGLSALAVRREDPSGRFREWITAEEFGLRARALRAIGELGRMDLVPDAERYLKAEEPEVRFSGAWSVALLSGKPEALSALAGIAQSDSPRRARALDTVMRRADPHAAKTWQRKLAQESSTLRLAVQGVGAIGDPELIPWLIEQMQTPELARVAGESFTTITGVDLAYQDLERDRPEGFESGPTEDPADANVEMDPDENLPWPDSALIQKWWQTNRASFPPGSRYLIGKPITPDWCKQVLRIGRQRQRAAAALELAMHQPGSPLFEVRAPGFRQKQLLGL